MTKRRFQLNPAEDNHLSKTLRVCEEIFNADVLPCDAELMAPSDLYAAITSGPSRTLPTTESEGARPFPYLAA
ncbi:hypothetical protein A5906_36875 [Bradyrhizobium sacchari]|uniref:Uncharacterized protein n=1 Tax=Bradyrhizobium sacchari TaxID=1399419 RepID=A0A560JK21_9BRAD|nr:hypothetical protein [Bradyrhizobium sacchari]OPY97827.1 hypothetical protein A5906_36875 [Bradyrhizobium sacchari]TWB57069.1 hypothetical protein FBZ94_106328 [Bradyrhizobium sacchari]TWB71346.1 hypothetical protein FBZ95_107328 [Bradyrhizobium sacchari]